MKVFLTIVFVISSVSGGVIEGQNYESKPSYHLHTRKDWGAAPSTDNRPLKTPVEYVVVHHTYKPGPCNTTKQCGDAMMAMQRYHIQLDWGDIGYHFCVGTEGGAYEGRGWEHVGIHAGKLNSISVGICLIGDWRTVKPPQVQLSTTKALIEAGVDAGAISPHYKLIGHMQVMSTECPGAALMEELSSWPHFIPDYI